MRRAKPDAGLENVILLALEGRLLPHSLLAIQHRSGAVITVIIITIIIIIII
jgi:hypothetical protein